MFRTDELLLIEILTYIPDVPPFVSLQTAGEKTVAEYVNGFAMDQIDDGRVYAVLMNGRDWKNALTAIKKNPGIMNLRIRKPHIDKAYGGGGGRSAVFLNDETMEAVVAFRGTATNEWLDDFLGANQIDSLQQINALEWYKRVYRQLGLERYEVTVTGHSKGAAKAKYIAILNDTPKRCVAFDGQGFSDEFIQYYKRRIAKRQGIIENHNVDFDYVNILLNDVGTSTYYIGHGYGEYGFIESHSPITYFDFGKNGKYTMRVNPNGKRPEMQIMDQFFNSLIRSGISAKEKMETNQLLGMLVEKAFAIGKEHTAGEFINILCDMVGNPQYSDNAAYLLAFSIQYCQQKPELLSAIRDIMHSFHADEAVKVIDAVRDLVTSRRINRLLNISDFLINHVNSVVVRYAKGLCSRKYDLELTEDQISKLLQVVCLTRDSLKNMTIHSDGSDMEVRSEAQEPDEIGLPAPEELKVVVLAGGLSNERNLSLRNGLDVAEVLKRKGYHVILLDSFMGYGSHEMKIQDAFANPERYSLPPRKISDEIPDLWAVRRRRQDQSKSYFGPNVLQICRQADLLFVALQGAAGENGKAQSVFDLLGIDYTGNGYFSSALSSNKFITKKLMTEIGIPVPKGYLLRRGREMPEPETCGLRYPVIVKPNNGGIGLGISVANDPAAFRKAADNAFRWDNEVLAEEYVAGREFAVSTLDGKALPVLEVLPLETGDKSIGMTIGGAKMQKCPADIPQQLADTLKAAAEKVSDVLGAKVYSKADFIVREDGSFVCLECDLLPQLYRDAYLVQEAEAEGISFGELCDRIIELSLKKQN